MTSSRRVPRTDPPAPRVVISHSVPWQPDRHGPAFLRPLIAGIRLRLAAKRGRGERGGPSPISQ